MSLAWRLFRQELLKALTYRVDFLTRIVGKALTVSLTSWFLWSSIFTLKGTDSIEGVTLPQMALYYLVLPLTLSLVMASDFDSISTEIYEGTLAKSLIYPRSFLAMTFVRRYSAAVISGIPYLLIGALFRLSFPEQARASLSFGNLVIFCSLCALAAMAYFLLASIFDILAFWFEQTWSLRAMVRFTALFLGGGTMPLDLLPDSMRAWTKWLPFESMVGLPTILLARGELPAGTLEHAVPVLLAWTAVFAGIFLVTWRIGLKRFAGSGM
jgi:ABC-2 type transport system permease protein